MIDNFTLFINDFLVNLASTDIFIFTLLTMACSAVFVIAAHLIGRWRT